MAHTIRRFPAVILAVIVAAALALTMGLNAQKAYAYEDDEPYPHIEFNYSNDTFYNDGEYVIPYDVVNAPDEYDVEFKVGLINDPEDGFCDWDNGWQKVFSESGGYYSVDKDAQTITMYGYKIWEDVERYIPEDVYLEGAPIMMAVRLYEEGNTEEPIFEDFAWINVHPIDVEYYTEPETYDGKILIGTIDVFSTIEGCVYNSDHQDGMDMHFDVTKVTSSDESIVKVTEEDGDWAYEGIAKGTATLTVTYMDYYGEKQSFTCKKTVVEELLDAYVEPVDGYFETLPGKSIALKVHAWHDIATDEGIQEGKITGYNWFLSKRDKKYASITKNKKDPTKATLKFKSTAKNSEVVPMVKVTAKDKNGKTITVLADIFLYSSTDFYQVSPARIPGEMKVGETFTLTPKVTHFTKKNPKGVPVNDAALSLEPSDPSGEDVVQITSNADKTEFYIKRLTADEIFLTLKAVESEGEEPDDIVWWDYYLDDVHFYMDGCQVLVDNEDWNVFTLDSKDGELSPDDMNITVVDWNGEVVPEDAYALKFYRSTGYDPDADEPIWTEEIPPLTIKGSVDKQVGFSDYSVVAEAIDQDICIGETDRTCFELFDKHSLYYLGANVNFGNDFLESPPDEGYFYNVPYSEVKDPVVYAIDKAVIPEDQYTLTYYKRPQGDYDEGELLETAEPLDGRPSDIGAYTVEIEATSGSDYYGWSLTDFDIGPDGTSLTKLAKAKKAFTAKWTKQTAGMPESQITGYEIQYSTDEYFDNSKTKVVKGASKASVKIKSLKKKTKYFVKIRTYMTVDGVDYYSPWSEVKTVKTK